MADQQLENNIEDLRTTIRRCTAILVIISASLLAIQLEIMYVLQAQANLGGSLFTIPAIVVVLLSLLGGVSFLIFDFIPGGSDR